MIIWVAISDVGLRTEVQDVLDALGIPHSSQAVRSSTATALVDSLDDARRLITAYPNVSAILVRRQGSEQLAMDAWKSGCRGYVRVEHLADDLRDAIAACGGADEADDQDTLVGASAAMRSVREYIRRVGSSPSNVLITGETGTGKELVAAMIHQNSSRREKPFVSVNCAALPDTLVESELFGYEKGAFTGAVASRDGTFRVANGGTVFLDEIGDMSLYAQAKILRCIETRSIQRLGGKHDVPVDIRIIAATNRPIEALAAGDRFRPDLYYRLSVANVKLPPLRDRREDLPGLTRRFLTELNAKFERRVRSVSPRSLRWLTSYEWPGNVRELRNVLEAAFIDLPRGNVRELDLPQAVEQKLAGTGEAEHEAESGALLRTLLEMNWNKSRTARALNWSRMTLYRKMKKYHLQGDDSGESHGA